MAKKRFYVVTIHPRTQWGVLDRNKKTDQCVYFTSGFRGRSNAVAVADNLNKEDSEDNNTTKFTFKTTKPTGAFIYGEDMDNDIDIVACGEENDEVLWWENDGSSFYSPNHDIKFKKKIVGSIGDKFPHRIRFMVIKDDINKDGNSNCDWEWIGIKKESESVADAKIFLNDHIELILKKYNLKQ